MKLALAILAAAIFSATAAAAEPPKQAYAYAFTSASVAVKQSQVREYFPAAVCVGKVPVSLVGGGRGYLITLCIDELDGPVQIRFRINSKGIVIQEYLWGDAR